MRSTVTLSLPVTQHLYISKPLSRPLLTLQLHIYNPSSISDSEATDVEIWRASKLIVKGYWLAVAMLIQTTYEDGGEGSTCRLTREEYKGPEEIQFTRSLRNYFECKGKRCAIDLAGHGFDSYSPATEEKIHWLCNAKWPEQQKHPWYANSQNSPMQQQLVSLRSHKLSIKEHKRHLIMIILLPLLLCNIYKILAGCYRKIFSPKSCSNA